MNNAEKFIKLCDQQIILNNGKKPKITMNLKTLNNIMKPHIVKTSDKNIYIYGVLVNINCRINSDLILFDDDINKEYFDIKNI